MADPFFSVIIPTYNRLSLLKEAVASVQAQSFKSWELIIADDGSSDGTREWLEGLGPDIRVLLLDHDGHPGAVRNRGAEIARGRWLAFLDSDDLWSPEKLERQAELIAHSPESVLVHTREVWRRGDRIVSQKSQKHRRAGEVFEDALWKCTIGPSTTAVRRDLFDSFGGFREDLEVAEDYELWLRICDRFKVDYIEEPLVIKRAGEWDQLSERYGQIEGFRISALRDLVESESFSPDHRGIAKEILAKKSRIFAQGAAKRGKREEAAEFQALALRLESSI